MAMFAPRRLAAILAAILASALAASAPAGGAQALQRGAAPLPGAGEALHVVGTEPFWGGTLRGTRLRLDWPENPRGVTARVSRRSAANRLTLAGTLAWRPHFMPARRFVMTVAGRRCSDGMSDRTYPYEVVLASGGRSTAGCGWTARRPYRDEPAG